MPAIDQARVTRAFDGADAYAERARIQRRIAADLASHIVALDLRKYLKGLEIGCGTGFLSQALADHFPAADWLFTDKSPSMVARCRETIGEAPSHRFAVLDGEYEIGDISECYDLIFASMAMQWFDDLPRAVGNLLGLLRPGGHLVFNTLAAETFREWRAAHNEHGVTAGTVQFPSGTALEAALQHYAPRLFEVQMHVEDHVNAADFIENLKLIGASTARAGHRPLAPGQLRRVMASFDANGASASYQVVTCHIVREGEP